MRFPSSAALASVLVATAVHGGDPIELPLGVGVGDTIGGTAVLSAKSGTGSPVTFEIATDPDFTEVIFSTSVTVTDAMVPAKAVATELDSGTRYFARAIENGVIATTTFIPQGTIAGTGGTQAGATFGITGDWRGDVGIFSSILNAPERGLEFFVKLGDTIYGDVPSPAVPDGPAETVEEFRAKHLENYAAAYGIQPWRDLAAVMPTFAMIDDHEVTNDFDGGRFSKADGWYNQSDLYRNGLQAFVEYNPMLDLTWPTLGDPRVDGRPNLYRSFHWGSDAAVFMVDTRSFRDANLPPVVNPFDPAEVQQFVLASFDPTRTMLGYPQLGTLIQDVIAADAAGATWKFILSSVAFQNFGPLAGEDRWEGYAAERAYILQQLAAAGVENVVFVCADLHGTVVNDITVPNPANPLEQLYTGSWEIITGSVAYSAPYGPTVAQLAYATGVIDLPTYTFYQTLPLAAQDAFLQGLLDEVVTGYGYSPTGIDDPSIDAEFEVGGPVAVHHYGWTEFDIDPTFKTLTVTTFGQDWYSPADVQADPAAVIARPITVRQKFTVQPADPPCVGDLNGDGTVDGEDLGDLILMWGECPGQGLVPCSADINHDGKVDGADLGLLIGGFGDC
jgi:phosphodiesterase/alkaline phosphatase D-like protein